MKRLQALGKRRFVGDSRTGEVHDRWHGECEDCLLEDLIGEGRAVGFEPDTLDGALSEGFDTCPYCMDRTEPPRPVWAGGGLQDTPDTTGGGGGTEDG
ncbi:MAG: hypothetical protein JXB46_09925 [Candidatus Eisenbacteria bacterium]|nr:hypothetical protein [Candidatus Eisenbacteria bacterium]